MKTPELKWSTLFINFLINHQQWPLTYNLAYVHRPCQLIQYLIHFIRTQELKKRKIYTFVSFSVRPQALPTYPNTRIYLYEQQRNKSTNFVRKKLSTIPFLTNHQQWPVALIKRTPTGLTNLSNTSINLWEPKK